MSEAGDEATERAGAAMIRAAGAEIVCVLGRLAARPLAEPVAAQMRQLLVRVASARSVRPARSSMSRRRRPNVTRPTVHRCCGTRRARAGWSGRAAREQREPGLGDAPTPRTRQSR